MKDRLPATSEYERRVATVLPAYAPTHAYSRVPVVPEPERFIAGFGLRPVAARTHLITRIALLVILGVAVLFVGLAFLAAELRPAPPPPPIIVEAPPPPAPVIVEPPQPPIPPRPLSHCVLFGLLCYDTPG